MKLQNVCPFDGFTCTITGPRASAAGAAVFPFAMRRTTLVMGSAGTPRRMPVLLGVTDNASVSAATNANALNVLHFIAIVVLCADQDVTLTIATTVAAVHE